MMGELSKVLAIESNNLESIAAEGAEDESEGKTKAGGENVGMGFCEGLKLERNSILVTKNKRKGREEKKGEECCA